jgi:type III secretion protein J
MKTHRFALVVGLGLTACSAQLHHGLDERDANELVTVLVARGLEARKVPEKGKKPTWAIEIDLKHANEALGVLTELKLPRAARATTRGLMQTTSLIETPSTERLRQLEAQEGDLEEALETMDGVTSAAVELVVPPAPRPGAAPVPSKASVLIRVRPEALERLDQQRPSCARSSPPAWTD